MPTMIRAFRAPSDRPMERKVYLLPVDHEEAERRGITLGTWDYLRHDARLEWDGRVYGEKVST